MEPRSPTERQAAGGRDVPGLTPSLGDVVSAFVRRMNDVELTPASVADAVAEDLARLLGGGVAVVLRDRGTGTTQASVRGPRASSDHLERAVARHGDEDRSAQKDFVDIVLDTGEPFVAPDGHDAGVGAPGEQQILAVPVVSSDGTLGVIAATRDDDQPFSGDDLDALNRVADVTALAVRGLPPADPSGPADPADPADRGAAPARPDRWSNEAAGALDSAADAIFIVDADGHLLSSNLATQRLLGYSDRELVGRALREIVADGSAGRRSNDLPDFTDSPLENLAPLYEVELQRDDGTVVAVELSFGRVTASDRELYIAVGRDVSQRKRFEETLRREASVDPLTGLVNRASAHRALGRSMHRADAGCEVAVLFIDLDGFKDVNDSSGHPAGDEVLRHVAERLTESVRHDDLVARYGGDEFLVVLEADQDIETEVLAVCARIETAFLEPFTVGSAEHQIGASIGLAIQGRDGTTISQMLAHADADMYRQKHARRRTDASA